MNFFTRIFMHTRIDTGILTIRDSPNSMAVLSLFLIWLCDLDFKVKVGPLFKIQITQPNLKT